MLGSNNATIANLALKHKLPSAGDEGFVTAGGLFSLSADYSAMARRSAWHVDKILKGTAPGDLAAEISTVFRLWVNLKTAKELGITIPPSVLARADGVVEYVELDYCSCSQPLLALSVRRLEPLKAGPQLREER
jgi:putative ABC transport system substrate-binding protein